MKKNKAILVGLALGLFYGLLARYLFGLDASKEYIEIMSVAFLFLVPIVLGAITVYFGTTAQRSSKAFRVFSPWTTVFVFLFINFITGTEALLCIVMLLPAFLFSSSIGGIIMGMILKSSKSSEILSVALFLPFTIGLLESNINGNESTEIVKTAVIINANKSAIWTEIKCIKHIAPSELKWTFSHFIGIPRPVNCELSYEGTGGKRKIIWDKGIEFTEHIKTWEPGKEFTYCIEIDTIPINAVDQHIEVGGKYFDIIAGGYRIEELGNSTYKLTLHTEYKLKTRFNFYSKFWADFILNDFHEAILEVAKQRIEKSSC